MITIYDIARETGYSAPTISKALNGTGKLSNATREKIVKIAEDMGYKFNMAAKTLATKKSNLIGVIFEDNKMLSGFQHPLFGGVLNRFREAVEAAGYDLVFLSRTASISYLNHARLRSVDGIVIINPNMEDSKNIEDLSTSGIPCISTNDYFPNICTVITDNYKGGYEGTEYLISQGHTKIAFLAGPISTSSAASLERYTGYKDCLKAHGIKEDKNAFEESDMWNSQSGYKAFSKLYERTQDFTAVFAADDMLALGIIQYAEDHQLCIPDSFSLMGFDDDKISSYCRPKLTTFQQNKNTIAELTAEYLLYLISGISEPPPSIKVPAKLIVRESVKKIN